MRTRGDPLLQYTYSYYIWNISGKLCFRKIILRQDMAKWGKYNQLVIKKHTVKDLFKFTYI
jgi:hypothetical protein